MFNKRKFNKINDKKVLHKVKKQWVTMSIALFSLIGGGALVSHTTVSANQDNNNNNTDSNTLHINTNQLNTNNASVTIPSQAKQMHQRLLFNAQHQANSKQQINLGSTSDSNSDTSISNTTNNITVNNKPAQIVDSVNQLRIHNSGIYNNYVYNRINLPFYKVHVNRPVELHSSADFNNGNIYGRLLNGQSITVNRAFKEYGQYNNYLRYEVNLNRNRTAFITGNPDFVSFVLPSKDYKQYQNGTIDSLKGTNSDDANNINQALNNLVERHSHNYNDYAQLYEDAFNALQNTQYPVNVDYHNNDAKVNSLINYLDTPAQNTLISSYALASFVPAVYTPSSTSSAPMSMSNNTNSSTSSTGSMNSASFNSMSSTTSSRSSNASNSMTPSATSMSISANTISLIDSMSSRMASMTPLASSLAQQKPQAVNDYNIFKSYSNDITSESSAYNTNNNLVNSYINDVNAEKSSASSENTSYLAANNTSAIKSLGTLVLSNISAASSNANLAYSAASVENSNFNQEMSNISYANSAYVNMQQNVFNKPNSSASIASNASSTNSNSSKIKKPLKLSMQLGSVEGHHNDNFNTNLLNKSNVEGLYSNELKETNTVEAEIQQLKDQHYYHNEELYDTTFGSVPNNTNNSDTNKQIITLTSVPLVPKQDNFVTSDLNFNNGKALPVPITQPLQGNDNNLISDYANSDGTGGINATLYPNGTFLMSNGVEHTGYFSPATMKIGWPNINGTQSDNNNYISQNNLSDYSDNSDNSDSDDEGAPYSKYNQDVISENFSDVIVTGNMLSQFASQPQMRFFRIKNSNFDGTYNYSDFFGGDKNLQSIQFENTKGILGGPNTDSDNWHLVDPSDWVDMSTGDTNTKDMTNGDVWINKKNSPVYHIFSIPVETNIYNNDGSVDKQTRYASVKGLLGNSTIINLSQLNLPGYTNISHGNAAVAFNINNNQFYYTNNGDTKNWINTQGINPTLVVNFKPSYDSNNQPKSDSSKVFSLSNYIAKHGGDKIGQFFDDSVPSPNSDYTGNQIPKELTGSDVKTSSHHTINFDTLTEAVTSLGGSVIGSIEKDVLKATLKPAYQTIIKSMSSNTWKYIGHALSKTLEDEITQGDGANTIADAIWKVIKNTNAHITNNPMSDITSVVGDIVTSFLWKFTTQSKNDEILKITPFGNIEFTERRGLIHPLDHYMKLPRATIKGLADSIEDTKDNSLINGLVSFFTAGNGGEIGSWLTGFGEALIEPVLNHYINVALNGGLDRLPPLITVRF